MDIERLKQLLNTPLPGEKAQEIMAPEVRHPGPWGSGPENARFSSVLILFYPKNGQWYLPLIQRPLYNGAHSGQISFPGGKQEEQDAGFLETALRETHEEIGVEPARVIHLGALTRLYIPKSNFFVYPQVGWMHGAPSFIPDPMEVDEVIEVSLDELLDESCVRTFTYQSGGLNVSAPYFGVSGKRIWGATAMILSEILEVIRRL
ncbi:NUDIX hydrolase [Marinilabilia rubra]|uniref:Coenzyme A pyrophosphatase n=1 Tax=Marinilabilia rubra TaxID=2162893 RepID=A0A2U2B4J4_9BACT|nr:CoA pyrophosphatase [Marinilabilia rubra]PWD97976.1 coenzyme A pyrophosphatase [Marinilabilia rubra]